MWQREKRHFSAYNFRASMDISRSIFVLSLVTLSGVALFVMTGYYWSYNILAMGGYLLAFFGAAALIPLALRDKLNESWTEN
ncbi:hypothetical protein C492_07420 [Natronococcus jeotgali DSM 18795]|uniref:Uncharacterized protein n=1 Tax=Natronococcus jeotgali DSM 18795 TaxID=1227498 RepID=L9XNR7_9EURY|nr:hypothetical protein C492_07420 [Natronococcus jeotgali DSM 18795]